LGFAFDFENDKQYTRVSPACDVVEGISRQECLERSTISTITAKIGLQDVTILSNFHNELSSWANVCLLRWNSLTADG